jgi:hypothetical protein
MSPTHSPDLSPRHHSMLLRFSGKLTHLKYVLASPSASPVPPLLAEVALTEAECLQQAHVRWSSRDVLSFLVKVRSEVQTQAPPLPSQPLRE